MSKYYLVAKIYRRGADGAVSEVKSFEDSPIDISEDAIPANVDITYRRLLSSLKEFIKELSITLIGNRADRESVQLPLDRIKIYPEVIPVNILDESNLLEEKISIQKEKINVKVFDGALNNDESANKNLEKTSVQPKNELGLNNRGYEFEEKEGASGMKTDVHIILRKDALVRAKIHATEITSTETGGALLGKILKSEFGINVIVTGIVRGHAALREGASVNITADTWADIWRSIDQDPDYQDEKNWRLVGWYHTHPNFGIFYSGTDQLAHHRAFKNHGQIGLVIDPVRDDYGFFCWDLSDKKVIRCPEGHIEQMNDQEILNWLQVHIGSKLMRLPLAEVNNNPASGVESIVKPNIKSTNSKNMDAELHIRQTSEDKLNEDNIEGD